MIDKKGYRRNIGIILMNGKGQVLWAKRTHQKSAWQFPQGGMDAGESEEQTLFRELKEELGLDAQDVEILGKTKKWLFYDIPKKYQRRSTKYACLGQKQRWFLLRLIADASKICLDACDYPEFDDWCWVDYWYPLDHVIAFKHDVYQKALKEFSSLVGK